jgi:hypothetical protein
MTLKIESSEFPSGVTTDEDKLNFAKEYQEKLGIDIDISKVQLNPGMRFISVSYISNKVEVILNLENLIELSLG